MSHVFPGFVAGHQESELLLNVVVVGIAVCFHAAEEVVLDRQVVCQTNQAIGNRREKKVMIKSSLAI